MNKIKIASVVVLYNPSQENINNISLYKKEVDRIYIVDNTDDNIKRINNTQKLKYIKLGENKGIAYALNIGAKKAIEDGYKWLLTMDQDSKMTEDIIVKMKDFLISTKEENVGLISPYQDIDSKEDNITKGQRDDYKKIGGFKDWLFIDCVDTDYCMNLHKHGYKVLRLNRIVMKHELGNLVVHKLFNKEYPCYNHNPIRRYYIVRNNLYINSLYKNLYPEYCKRLLRIQKGQVKRIIVFEKNKFQKLRMMYKGYRDYKKGIKGKLE